MKANPNVYPKHCYKIPSHAEKVFSGVIYDVYQWQQTNFDGSKSVFEMLKRPDTVDIVAIIDGEVVCIRERQPHWTTERLAVPGGRVDDGESWIEAAQRELREETGYEFSDWKLLRVVQPVEKMEWFVATYVAFGNHSQTPMHHDSGEQISVELRPLAYLREAYEATKDKRLCPDIITGYASAQDIINAPEYKG